MTSKINSDLNSFDTVKKRKWGFTNFSEKLNGRIAMVSFVILFLLEFFTKHKVLQNIN